MFESLISIFKKRNLPFDYSFGNSEINDSLKLLQKENFNEFSKLFDNLSSDKKHYLIQSISADYENYVDKISSFIATHRSPLALTLQANNLINVGWKIRTGARAEEVSDEQFNEFHEYLYEAKELLDEAIEIDEDFSEAYIQLLRICVGLGFEFDKEVVFNIYNHILDLVPNHVGAYYLMSNYLSPKWYGSMQELDELSNEINITEIPVQNYLVLTTLAQKYSYMWYFGDKDEAIAFYEQDSVKLLIKTAYNNSRVLISDTSLFVNEFRSAMAFSLYMISEVELAKREIMFANNYTTKYPWYLCGMESNNEIIKYFDRI